MIRQSAYKIVTANHLLEGHSVFLSEHGWTVDHQKSCVANGADEVAALEALGRKAETSNQVVGVYLVDVMLDSDGRPEPIHYREKMRALARPSFWPAPAKSRFVRTVRNMQREESRVSV